MGETIPCSVCGQPASVHLTQISSSEVTKVHFCETCAMKNGAMSGPLAPIAHALTMLQKQIEGQKPQDDDDDDAPLGSASKSCPVCGFTGADFTKARRLGCAACYKAFESELQELLPRIQPGAEHKGKVPDRKSHV
jgi:protein arginine kinase activator